MGALGIAMDVQALGGGQTLAQQVNDYLDALGTWTLDVRFNETTGNLVNYGSDGNSGTVFGATQGQTGQLGANEAYSYDGVDDIVTFANAAIPATKALTTQRWVFLIKANSLGEGSGGRLFDWADANNGLMWLSASNRLNVILDAATTDPVATSNINQVDFLTTWALVFMDYDDGNDLGLGRKIRLMRATAASPTTLLTLSTDTAAVGTLSARTEPLNIGNRSSTDFTFNGLFDFARAGAGLWSPNGTPADLTRCEGLRSIVFGV